MNIFYINIDEFKKCYSKDVLLPYDDICCKNEKRFYEYCLGRYLVKTVGKNIYNILDTEVIIGDNNKPEFKNSDIYFNISHSKNIVIVCFDTYPCAIDIEYIKNRDITMFSKFFNKKFNTQLDFYKFWTHKEASYKLNDKVADSKFEKIFDNYFLCVVSSFKVEYKIVNFLDLKCVL